MEVVKNFLGSRMNKSLDERLVRNGEYLDALNVRISSDEDGQAGSVENAKGNELVASLKYNGQPLTNAKCIGAFEDGARETIYWFVKADEADMICSYNVSTKILVYHVVSESVLNFSTNITGVDMIEDLLFFTDNVNPPRRINVTHKYDNVTEDDISVIVKPPLLAPSIELITQVKKNNYIEDKFIRFAYRYKYKNGEYSALSQFSDLAFEPSDFLFDYGSFDMTGMRNVANAVNVTFNTGGKNVVGVDLCFKQSNSTIVQVIEKFDKADEGWFDNQNITFTFDNQKIYTALPQSELLRLYDNVPKLAKAQTVMGNRIVYGNYVDGYDIDTNVSFTAEPIEEEIGYTQIEPTEGSGIQYTIHTATTIQGSALLFDLSGLPLKKGSSLYVNFNILSDSFSGDTGAYTGAANNYEYTYQFVLPKDYSSVAEMVADTDFLSTIQHDYAGSTPLGDAYSFTDLFFESIAAGSGWIKQGLGITNTGESFAVSQSNGVVSIQIPAVKYTDGTNTVYEYFQHGPSTVSFIQSGSRDSLHSNRDYEVGMVYVDEYGRSTTAITDSNNTVYIPPQNSRYKNNIEVSINSLAPSWASRYRFVLKPSKTNYETVYSSIYFQEINDSSYWVKLDGDNQNKIKVGDDIIVKVADSGPTNRVVKTKVLDLSLKEADFLTDISSPSGFYMKIKPSNFTIDKSNDDIIDLGSRTAISRSTRIDLLYPAFTTDDQGVNSEYVIPASSQVKIFFENSRDGKGNKAGSRYYIFDRTFISTRNYDSLYDFIIGENIDFTEPTNNPEVESSDDTTPTAQFIRSVGDENDFTEFIGDYTSSIDITDPSHTEGVTKIRYFRHSTDGRAWLGFASAGRRADGKNYITTAHIEVIRSGSLLVFETEAAENPSEIFYEGSKSYPILNRYHIGNVQNQSANQPCKATVDIFDCFSFGNGVESFKIDDALDGVPFNPGERVTSVTEQDYREAHRFADLTYSGVYNQESNVNKLNEFNLALANFKSLEQSFGPIQRIVGRQTDILVLQEDKISYVLSGKNLLTDAGAGNAIFNTPEVLGNQVARVEEYGISDDGESFAKYGTDVFFTDSKRGAVINLTGSGSYTSEQLSVVSNAGMRSYFRDLFIDNMSNVKLGAFDPYSNEYILTVTDDIKPKPLPVVEGGYQICQSSATETVEYKVLLSSGVGNVILNYEISSGSTVQIDIIYDGQTVVSTNRTGTSTVQFSKTKYDLNYYTVRLQPSSQPDYCITLGDVNLEEVTVFKIVRNSLVDAGKTIHIETEWSSGAYQSGTHSQLVQLKSSGISLYERVDGLESVGIIPSDGATVVMRSNKKTGDTYDFDQDRFKKLTSDTLYTEAELADLLDELQLAGEISNPSVGVYESSFTNPGFWRYIYLVWDFAEPAVSCTDFTQIDETRSGYFETIVDFGVGTGLTEVTLDSGYRPARFQIEYEGQIVADSLWIGDILSDPLLGQDEVDLILLKSYTYPRYVHTAGGFERDGNKTVGSYTTADIAVYDGSETRATGSGTGQLGVVAGYPASSSLASESQIKLVFSKSFERYAKIIVHRLREVADDWNIVDAACPPDTGGGESINDFINSGNPNDFL